MQLKRIIGYFLIFVVYHSMCVILFGGDIPYYETHGYGTETEGGLSGTVIKVTNLNNSGPGSFRAACEDSCKRIAVFEVGGVIDLELSTINVTNPYLTIAGQTAPSPGITLIKGHLTSTTHDVVIQHIAVRPGDATIEMDAISTGSTREDVHHVVFDHCSATWATDENLSLVNASSNHDITIYKCLIGEGLNFNDHSCGSLIYGYIGNLTIIGCLYAHNIRRNPRINNNTEFVLANNIFYNWGSFSDNRGDYANCVHLREARGSIVGNLALGGHDTQDFGNGLYFVRGHDGIYEGEAYFEDNLIKHADGQSTIEENDELIRRLDSKPLWPEGLILKTVPESVNDVLRTVGARAGERDTIDGRIVNSVIYRSGTIINRQSDVEGYPQYTMTTRSLTVPDSTEQRREWLDSLSAAIDTDESLDTSPLTPLLTAIDIKKQQRHQDYSLHLSNTPNPFNFETKISFEINMEAQIVLKIFDVKGQYIRMLVDKNRVPGQYTVHWYGKNNQDQIVPSGIYFCRLQAGEYFISKKLILLK